MSEVHSNFGLSRLDRVVTLFTDPFLHFCKKGHFGLALFTFSVKWDQKSLFTDEVPFLRIFAYFHDF